jgi:hypothetical protein
MTKDPLSEFLTIKKNLERCSGDAGYISSWEMFSFVNNKKSRPSNFLFQIARGSGATLSEWARHSKDFFKIGPLQDFTSKEPRTSLIHHAKLEKQGGLRVQPWNARGLVDAGPIGFPSDVTTNHGPWPSPRAKARRDATSVTPTPSRIG